MALEGCEHMCLGAFQLQHRDLTVRIAHKDVLRRHIIGNAAGPVWEGVRDDLSETRKSDQNRIEIDFQTKQWQTNTHHGLAS